jgi:diacylglycerol kinase family enzyme
MTRRYLVLLNGSAGTCAQEPNLEARIRSALGDGRPGISVDVVRSTSPEQAIGAARVARMRRYTAVVAVGGDGTLGTANDLALEYGIPGDVEEACRIIRRGARTRVDLVTVADKSYATGGGMGLANDVAEGVAAARKRSRAFHLLMRLLGGWIYSLFMVYTVLCKRKIEYDYTIWGAGNTVRRIEGYTALIMNQGFLGKNFKAVPEADNRDGEFDVLLIKRAPRFPRIKLLLTLGHSLRGTHIGRPDVEVLRAQKLTITTPRTAAFFADGELVAEGTRFEVGVRQHALPLLVPEARAEQASKPSGKSVRLRRRRRQRESAAA